MHDHATRATAAIDLHRASCHGSTSTAKTRMGKAKTRMGKDGGGQRVRCGSSTLALSRRLVDLPLRLLEKDVIVLLEMQVRSEEERQSGSSSGCAGRLRVHMPAWSSDLSCRTSLWPSLGRLLCARVMSIEHDAFFSFYRPQVALPIKTGGEVLGVPMSIGKHRRGRPGKAGVDYQGHTGRGVQRRGAGFKPRPWHSASRQLKPASQHI